MLANLENSAVATGLEKISFHSNPKEEQCQKSSNYHTIALFSHASKVIFKILQVRLEQCVNQEFPDIQLEITGKFLGLEKAEESEIKLPTFIVSEKARGFQAKKNLPVLH